MKIMAVDHVTINCMDIGKAKKFYEEVLGLACLSVADLGDHVLHYYPLAGGVRLELIAYKNTQRRVVAGNTDTGIYRHAALRVDNLDALHAKFLSSGVPINLPPTWISQIHATVMLAVDPSGVEMEFIQDTAGED